ncbi:hypothetical protein GPY51_07665 [Photorhabdus laumondii subsp. laumondii]|uniref:Uncharacterized protein n=1 Tax=Photorhabdus laumondii subsp. laumondii TaxID=141679 RepID=A0A6L9JLY4_PHOLM|nr:MULTISPECIES: hypothetical protein [Photorhabdus]MCC8382247.1 hypothetical protein [Photorhabdus laumondii]MCC8412524.1 hypothetical protein [Photorhabdus laumondii]NDK94232.1 hypothetical protein [Photorhabdus laumondii subsp. laumondii]NDL19755.1 hypothetical protein [Photorhabdus laumondii subsp. laumondii]NDL29523.1 hypothetical protein [Photorhabdus laumondii subsp. laumondii]
MERLSLYRRSLAVLILRATSEWTYVSTSGALGSICHIMHRIEFAGAESLSRSDQEHSMHSYLSAGLTLQDINARVRKTANTSLGNLLVSMTDFVTLKLGKGTVRWINATTRWLGSQVIF